MKEASRQTTRIQQPLAGQPPLLRRCLANGVDFAFLELGQGPLVLCLHGFPDTAHSFSQLQAELAAKGYRVVAPFMRGYYPSGLAGDGDYSIPALGLDVLCLIEALGEEQAIVIGHDWGAFAAYSAAVQEPARISHMVAMSVPPMYDAAAPLIQLKKSWYVLFFQLPLLPEMRVPKSDFAFIERLYRSWSPGWDTADYDLGPVKRCLATPGSLEAALAYYRAMVRGSSKQSRDLMARQISVKTLCIAGEADGCVDIGVYANIDKAFVGEYRFASFADVGHFPHREDFPRFFSLLLEFLED